MLAEIVCVRIGHGGRAPQGARWLAISMPARMVYKSPNEAMFPAVMHSKLMVCCGGVQEGVRWLSASMPARMVQRFLQQAKQAMSLAYARPYAALTALGGSIVVIGLLIHNRSLREQLRTSTGRIERLEKTLAKVTSTDVDAMLCGHVQIYIYICICVAYVRSIR